MTKYIYLWVVQGHYGHGWEDLCASTTRQEAKADLKAYRENEVGVFRVVQRRMLNARAKE